MGLRALGEQRRVIEALFLREIKTRFGESRLGYLWLFIEPAIYLSVMLALWAVMGRFQHHEIEPFLFLTTGIVPFLMFRSCVTRVMTALAGNKALLVFPQINMLDFVIARAVLEFVSYSVVFVLFLVLAQQIGFDIDIKNPLGVIFGFVVMWLLGTSFGLVLLSLNSAFPVVEKITSAMIRLLYFTSGIIFSVNGLPYAARPYVIWNPIFQAAEIIRVNFFFGLEVDPDQINLTYLYFCISFLMLTGLVLKERFLRFILND